MDSCICGHTDKQHRGRTSACMSYDLLTGIKCECSKYTEAVAA